MVYGLDLADIRAGELHNEIHFLELKLTKEREQRKFAQREIKRLKTEIAELKDKE